MATKSRDLGGLATLPEDNLSFVMREAVKIWRLSRMK